MRDLPPAGSTLRDVIFAVRQLIVGRSNAAGTVTLTENVTSTTIVGANVNENAEIFFTPKTANAAAEMAAGTMYASITRISGTPTVTITHANGASTDRTFGYVILGG
jgi:hypothetical protein